MSELIEGFIEWCGDNVDDAILHSTGGCYAFLRGKLTTYGNARYDLDHILKNIEDHNLTLWGYMAVYIVKQNGLLPTSKAGKSKMLRLYGLSDLEIYWLQDSIGRFTQDSGTHVREVKKGDLELIFGAVLISNHLKVPKPAASVHPTRGKDALRKSGLPCEVHNPNPIVDFDLIMREIQRSCKR